jgi:hypothetical protein
MKYEVSSSLNSAVLRSHLGVLPVVKSATSERDKEFGRTAKGFERILAQTSLAVLPVARTQPQA